MRGYMWKRGPGADDTDKGKSLKRLFFKSEAYKRRYFVLDSVKLELKYYADYSRGTELGCIDLLSVVSVSYEDLPGKDFPYNFPWCLTTDFRDWVLCCENEEEFKSWKREMSNILKRRENGTTSDATMSKNERNGMCLEAPPLTIQRSVMDEADYKGNAQHSQSGKSLFRKSNTANNASKGKLNSFSFKRRSCVHNGSFRSDALLLQRARLGEESVYNSYTGNVGIAATATFSKFDVLDKLEFFQVLMSSCHDDVDVLARHQLVTKFLGECQFEFYTEEGEILIEEGRKFEWIYFVLEGEIGQRKTWASDTNRIDEKISVGECAGFVEALHFNSISSKTLLVGPGTICLKMSVASFRKQFLLQFKDKAKFSSAMEPTSTLYMERMLAFTHKCLTHLPLLQRQPVANIQALSHIFEPVFIASGDHLMDAGESSNMFYIVIEGSCSVFQKSTLDADEVDEIVRSCRAGDWVGEAGLINIQSRHITVVANSDVIALCTNAAGFKRFMDITGPSVREAITQSTTTYLSGMLKTIPLFLNVDESQIMDISREIEIRELERDAMLCDAGERLDDLYIILHGYVQCAISAVSGLDLSENPPFIDSMRENDFFGESAVLYDNPPVSRLQYLTPPDVKVVVLCIPATKIKTFLPSCPILRLRFEERLLVRKNHIDLIDTLVNSIAISMSARYDNRLSGRSRSKQSLGHMADMKAKEASYMNDEVLYLREEVKRLNGVQYVDTLKSRSQSRALSTFKSTIRRIKSSLPISAPQSKAPEIGLKSKKKSVRLLAKEAAFELAGNQVFRDEEGSALSTNSSLYSTQTADVIKLESLSCEEFLTVSPRAEENLFGYSDSDVDNASVDSVEDKYDSSSDGSSSESGTDNSSGQNSVDLIPQLSPRKQDAAINALIEPDEVDEEHTISSSKMAKRSTMKKFLNRNIEERESVHEIECDLDLDKHLNLETMPISKKERRLSPPKSRLASRSPVMKDSSVLPQKTSKPKNMKSNNNTSVVEQATTENSAEDQYIVDAMYVRMMKMKLPEAAIRKKMISDGVPVEAIENFFQNS